MTKRYQFKLEESEGEYSITVEDPDLSSAEGKALVAEFFPEVRKRARAQPPGFDRGILKSPVLFTDLFFEDSFEEGDTLDDLDAILVEHLESVRVWKKILHQHPEVEVTHNGTDQFAARVKVRFDAKLRLDESCLKAVEEKLAPLLAILDLLGQPVEDR